MLHIAAFTNKEPPCHDCFKNWNPSSKAIDNVASSVIRQIEASKKCNVGINIMDEDSTTVARLRQNNDHDINKWSNLNHIKKHLGNSLWKLNAKVLKSGAIVWLQRCFTYVVRRNKNNPSVLKENLLAIVPLAFGHYGKYSTWCGFVKLGQITGTEH